GHYTIRQLGAGQPQATPEMAGLRLVAVRPNRTYATEPFNVQPDGASAISLECQGAVPGVLAMLDGTILPTVYGSSTFVSAVVPVNLVARPGVHQIQLRNGAVYSNSLTFVVDGNHT